MSKLTRKEEEQPLTIMDGLHAFGGGIAFIVTTPSVWGYALVPVVVALAFICCLGIGGFWGAGQVSNAWFGSPAGFWAHLGWWLVTGIATLFALIVGILLALCLAQPLSGFALDALVYAQERNLTGYSSPAPQPLAALLRTWKVALTTMFVGGPIFLVLFLINWIFPPALLVTVPLKILFGAWVLAWNFLDYPLGIRGFGIRQRIKWVIHHIDACTTFGLAWAMVAIIPGGILIVLPMGVAGATRLVVLEETRHPN